MKTFFTAGDNVFFHKGHYPVGNHLRVDTQMGVFDERMPSYQLVRIRKQSEMGYTGFEHRYDAVDLQHQITALAYHYILTGKIAYIKTQIRRG